MATVLTSLLGTELSVGLVAPAPQRTFTGFAGANGLTAMNMGLRGYAVPIVGVIRVYGANYAAARAAADTAINAVAALQALAQADYTHNGSAYYNAVFGGFRILPQGDKTYHYSATGYMVVKFTINLIGLSN